MFFLGEQGQHIGHGIIMMMVEKMVHLLWSWDLE